MIAKAGFDTFVIKNNSEINKNIDNLFKVCLKFIEILEGIELYSNSSLLLPGKCENHIYYDFNSNTNSENYSITVWSGELIVFDKNPKYNIFPIMKFIEEHMIPLKEAGVTWGYDIPYLLTGRLNQHPSSAIDYMKEQRTDYTNFYIDLLDK